MKMKVTRSLTVALEYDADEAPRFKPWFGAHRQAAWLSLTVRCDEPVVLDNVRVTGRGLYVNKDGNVGRTFAEMRFGRLGDLPVEVAATITALLEGAAS